MPRVVGLLIAIAATAAVYASAKAENPTNESLALQNESVATTLVAASEHLAQSTKPQEEPPPDPPEIYTPPLPKPPVDTPDQLQLYSSPTIPPVLETPPDEPENNLEGLDGGVRE